MDSIAFTLEEKKTAVDIVCERISAGESVRTILATGRPDNLPSFMVFMRWLNINDEFAKQYTRAMEVRADLMFEEMVNIADATLAGEIIEDVETDSGFKRSVKKIDAVDRARLMVDTRKWVLSRMNPKKYGDKNTVEISNPALDEVRAQFPNFKAGERVSKE